MIVPPPRPKTIGDIEPSRYPDDGGYPFLNLARFCGLPYDWVLNDDPRLPHLVRQHVRMLNHREVMRKAGALGSLGGKN